MVSFYAKVYEVVRCIPTGKVSSYGRIARMLWAPQASRAVGYALRGLRHRIHDPDYSDIPWHRVVSKEGIIRVGVQGEEDLLQVELLQTEGVEVGAPKYRVDMKKHLWKGLSPEEVGELIEQLELLKEAATDRA